MNVITAAVIMVLSLAFIFQFSLPYKSIGKTRVLYVFIPLCFLTSDGLKIVLIRFVTVKHFKILTYMIISPSYGIKHPRYLHVFWLCTKLLLVMAHLYTKHTLVVFLFLIIIICDINAAPYCPDDFQSQVQRWCSILEQIFI
jgi:hypothetical protein